MKTAAPRRRLVRFLFLGTLLVLGAGVVYAAAGRSALWHVVHDLCVPDQRRYGDPAPCAAVDLYGGYALLKDLRGNEQYLLIPTARVTGIEDPAVLAPGAPNYWKLAWDSRHRVERRVGHALPRDAFALAINSRPARTQDQLHIHVDCIRADVRRTLRREQGAIGMHWAPLPVRLAGWPYRAMRMVKAEPGHPFRLLARSVPAADMGLHTLVLAGATFGVHPGFVLLDSRAGSPPGNPGWGEMLQDHDCALAH